MEENAPEHKDNYYPYYPPTKESNWKNNIRNPLAAINWRRMGHAIDRQFGVLGGFFSSFTGFFNSVAGIASNAVNIYFRIFTNYHLLILRKEKEIKPILNFCVFILGNFQCCPNFDNSGNWSK